MSSPHSLRCKAASAVSVKTASPVETHGLGQRLAKVLRAGDVICISGPLGAGKSELCRAIIRGLIRNTDLEVPSPSYTLVNVYDHSICEIWHADLYRIGDDSEIQEIGLDDAVEDAIVLVEWPERWANPPERRIDVSLRPLPDETREIFFEASGQGWDDMLDAIRAFS